MVKHRGPIKSWRPLSTVSHHLTSLCGVHISSGWSLPTTFSATCLSMFEVSLGYQPSLLSATEGEYAVPSVQHHLCHCCCFWRCTWVALLRTKEQNKCVADHHMVPTLPHQPGQKVWLSIRNIPLWTESKKLTPCFIDPFEIQSIINAVYLFKFNQQCGNSQLFSCLPAQASPDCWMTSQCYPGSCKR